MKLNNIIADVLESFAERLRSDSCELTTVEAEELLSQIAHIKLNKQEVAERYNVSEKTIERKEQSGEIPQSYKQSITKKIWYLDELIAYEKSLSQK